MDEDRKEFLKPPNLSIELKLQYRILKPSAPPSEMIESLTKDVDVNGLGFESKEEIPLDTEIEIVIEIPGLTAELLNLKGKVVKIAKAQTGNFVIGINFTAITPEQKSKINQRVERMNIINLLEQAGKKEISDLHLTVNTPPMVRHYGEMQPLSKDPLNEDDLKRMIYSILTEEQKAYFEREKGLDFSYSPSFDLRFRVSVYQQRGIIEAVFRNIMPNIKSRIELGLPEVIDDLCKLKDGIIVIAGSTGSGKTSTITTMVDAINRERGGVILTLEKPVEYLHSNIKGIVKQREVGIDVPSFASGLKAALRQDPDVIVVGEILDADTLETAIQASETGHLLVTSLHAADTLQVLDRILSLFPADQKSFICARLSHSLKAIITQKLLPSKDGSGRVIATEVCIANTAVKRVIHSGDFTQLVSVMQTGSQFKMQLMQSSIDKLYEVNLISGDTYETYTRK